MKSETEPVTYDEFVFRRILDRSDFFDAHCDPAVQRVAMVPTDNDTDGLSVFREACGATRADVAERGANPAGYLVARLAVADLIVLGLTVTPAPDPDQPVGHAVIPELTKYRHQIDKRWAKQVELELARLASRDIIRP